MFFFFNDTPTTEIYPLPLHDALPISRVPWPQRGSGRRRAAAWWRSAAGDVLRGAPPPASERNRTRRGGVFPSPADRKSTRLNSSHANISYAVFCLKKKKNTTKHLTMS